jgi:hypothetical protein
MGIRKKLNILDVKEKITLILLGRLSNRGILNNKIYFDKYLPIICISHLSYKIIKKSMK